MWYLAKYLDNCLALRTDLGFLLLIKNIFFSSESQTSTCEWQFLKLGGKSPFQISRSIFILCLTSYSLRLQALLKMPESLTQLSFQVLISFSRGPLPKEGSFPLFLQVREPHLLWAFSLEVLFILCI